ncbi:hypothetical protein P152DRAFT_207958 [Eremomyces bilateralis CBS 781.70]|uniref:Uncharacterized protein n=1 Tax=Eremomyces bilateralis CBS 781.70 TaxID=1392243 RepID=A0A6G1FSI8_9PEZI|nr:uncharacterized protein P152DRAFT_207958 [Eremomyces bilateralis CBS 781.70]KAF1808747.1 hypothetical protein P152DRAFT_207958 [Eremomyces bilateralis CBS 781.70]
MHRRFIISVRCLISTILARLLLEIRRNSRLSMRHTQIPRLADCHWTSSMYLRWMVMRQFPTRCHFLGRNGDALKDLSQVCDMILTPWVLRTMTPSRQALCCAPYQQSLTDNLVL